MKTVSLILLFACCFSGCQHNGNKRSVLHMDPTMMASHGETPIRIEPGAALEPFIGKRIELVGTVSDDKIPQLHGVELRGFERFRGRPILVSGVLQRTVASSKVGHSGGAQDSGTKDFAPVYWLEYTSWSAHMRSVDQERDVSSQESLYLHFFTPDTDPIRTQPPHCILTTEIQLAKDINIRDSAAAEIVSGRIESRGEKFFAKLSGRYGPSIGNFSGEIELERPFSPSNYGYSEPEDIRPIIRMIRLTRFVLSTNSDCKPFLENLPASGVQKVKLPKASPTLKSTNARRISVVEVGSVRLEVEQPTWETQAQIRVRDFEARNHEKKSVSCDIYYVGQEGNERKLKSLTLHQASPTSGEYSGLSPAEEEFAHGSMIKVVYKSERLRLPISTWCAFYYH